MGESNIATKSNNYHQIKYKEVNIDNTLQTLKKKLYQEYNLELKCSFL